jgi:hypothetical protein
MGRSITARSGWKRFDLGLSGPGSGREPEHENDESGPLSHGFRSQPPGEIEGSFPGV